MYVDVAIANMPSKSIFPVTDSDEFYSSKRWNDISKQE